jgi:hypothetical protein
MAYIKPDSDETYKIEDELGKRGNGETVNELFSTRGKDRRRETDDRSREEKSKRFVPAGHLQGQFFYNSVGVTSL